MRGETFLCDHGKRGDIDNIRLNQQGKWVRGIWVRGIWVLAILIAYIKPLNISQGRGWISPQTLLGGKISFPENN